MCVSGLWEAPFTAHEYWAGGGLAVGAMEGGVGRRGV